MKITDKMRLDWLTKRVDAIRLERACAGLWKLWQYDSIPWEYEMASSPRKAIDAAIRASRRGKKI